MPPRIGKNARGKSAPPIKKAEQVKDPQALGPKEAPLLAQVFQQYEEKKFAASVKTADLILKKQPDHGQTLCMKGLSTYNLGRREEGKDLARKGLTLDLNSHVCWHVMALIHRADREFDEALKCYTQANRCEPNDLNVLRDLINLQLFSRKYKEASVSRLNLLRLQPRIRYNWLALANAYHFSGDLERALEYLDIYLNILEDVPPHDFELSEVLMYKAQICEEAGHAEKALDVLEKESRRIVDQEAKKVTSARLLKSLGRAKAAELKYAELLEDNPDNKAFIEAHLSCKGIQLASLDDSKRREALDALAEMSDRLPRSRTIRRTVLDVSAGDVFRKRLSAYVLDGLTKGIPSLFSDIKYLLENEEKQQIIIEVANKFLSSIEAGKPLEESDATPDSEEAPTTYIWLLYLLAQISLHTKDNSKALYYIDKALAHTPVLPDLFMTKARILKRSGDYLAAEEAMRQARALDGQDRFLNAKHVKYLLKIDEVERAEDTAGLFTRKDAESPLVDLTDMQCLWFLLAEAESYRRQGKLGLALKRYHSVEKIFAEVFEDEFEFHAYCMRKFTLRSCVNMARSNNVLKKHPGFLRAAKGAVEIYLELDLHPATTNGTHDADDHKEAKQAATPAKVSSGAEAEGDAPSTEVDDDPNGEKLRSTKTPLKDAEVFVKALVGLGNDIPAAQELIFKLAFRRGELLRALKALQLHHILDPASPVLHVQVLEFAAYLQRQSSASGSARALLEKELEVILPLSTTSLEAYNTAYLQQNPGKAEALLAAAKGLWAISGQKDKAGVHSILLQLARKENVPSVSIIEDGFTFLRDVVQVSGEDLESFRATAKVAFPLALVLKTPEELETEKQSIADARRVEREAGNEDEPSPKEAST